ncbi:MAG: hypothetical protein ACRYFL_01230 [Janthinobacterium lividum]
MADKDLLEIIADMLQKLDQHSETLELQNKALQKQGEVLTAFMEGSLKQFDQQLVINEKIVNRLDNLESGFKRS